MIQIVTIEREFGCGGSEIARKLARRLGWKLWDELLTLEIARLTKSAPEAVERKEWRNDPLAYRILKSFLRGAFEGSVPPTHQLELLDAEWIAKVSERVVKDAAVDCPCVIVGRGAQYFLQNRKDVLRAFLYCPREEKIHRLVSAGRSLKKALEQVESVDKERATFIKRYFEKDWPNRHLYHLMLNTAVGDEAILQLLLQSIQNIDSNVPRL